MTKSVGININFPKVAIGKNEPLANNTEVKPNLGEQRVLTRQQAFAPQRAKERDIAKALRIEYAASNEEQSAPQKASVAQPSGGSEKIKTHKWPSEKRFVISSNSDWIIKNDSKVHATERKVPKQNFFLKAALNEGSLANVNLEGRLTLIGHGNSERFDGMNASQLAAKLADAGLKQVGVLKFKACNVAKGNYLEEVKEALNHQGIKVGYIAGPTGVHTDLRFPIKISGKNFYFNPLPFLPPKTVGNPFMAVTPEKFGLRTIKGNIDISFKGTRYDTPSSPSTSESTSER